MIPLPKEGVSHIRALVADMVPSNKVRVVVSDALLAVPVRESGALPLCAERVSSSSAPTGTFPRREGEKPLTAERASAELPLQGRQGFALPWLGRACHTERGALAA